MITHSMPESQNFQDEDCIRGYSGFEVLEKGIFTKESGFDPLAMRVKCRSCGHVYILFPLIGATLKETE